ncbi:MAG: HAD family phosphatase [Chloroflexi bacterium]|nr:HAD family phosphatase [Chloroflexota bacterium]
MTEIELVAFDMGNVLTFVDEGPPAAEYARLSGSTIQEVINACYTKPRKRVLETGSQTWIEFVEQTRRILDFEISEPDFRAIFASSVQPDRRMYDLVDSVVQQKRIALCSNTHEVHWEMERDRMPSGRKMNPAIVSYEVGVMKPAPLIYEALIEQSGVEPGQILFIDDLEENIEGAQRLGIAGLVFRGREQLIDDLSKFGIVV